MERVIKIPKFMDEWFKEAQIIEKKRRAIGIQAIKIMKNWGGPQQPIPDPQENK